MQRQCQILAYGEMLEEHVHILVQEEDKLREALVFANGCGALIVMEKGAILALPAKEKYHGLLYAKLH
ncbi:hypothetical protein RHSIM_Rhsim01G0160600 [Rhododendron simsii]|uniref:Uncharacterized protein n=1 Tax=Rhododendron simsii TaxID=118357 RepID=A0A834HFL2_RHOSS|nr:hypothetical protein RHSIM_Rhsim01G0160600 [Rhododendron simsii]